MPQLKAELRDDPAKRTGKHQHKYGDQNRQQHATKDRHDGGRRYDPVDDDCGNDDHCGVHQPHEVDGQQPRGHQCAYRDGHGEQQIVVPGKIQAGKRVEHAAERTEKHCKQPHQRKVEPAHAKPRQRAAERNGQECENTAEHTDHQQRKHRDITDDRAAGALFVLLCIIEVAAVYLHQLLFNERFQHDSPSSSRKTSSSESSPLTSSIVPERISRPALMMATLSQSFSATSRTCVEKKIAPP